jgi:glycosyltransferase involved in cell wall biosynthesis
VLVISNLGFGGAERQVVDLVNHLDARRLDARLVSLSPHVPLADGLTDRDRLHVIRRRCPFDATVVPRLARLLRSFGADIVHSHLYSADIAARLAGRWAGTRVIGSELNADYRLTRRHLLLYRFTRGCMDLLIANSRAGAEFNRRVFGHGESQVRVVRNGVDTERFRPRPRDELRRRAGLPQEVPLVGMFASFKEQKNHALLFEAARRVLDRMPQVRFLFVGDEMHDGRHGSALYKRRMQGLVDRLRLRPSCIFLGNRPDVADLYGACDLTALPSLHEGTPNVVLESMSCGVPVVLTAVADNADIVPDGRAGFLVPSGDAAALAERMARLIGDEDLRRDMGQSARERVLREFPVRRFVEGTAAVYEDALRLP